MAEDLAPCLAMGEDTNPEDLQLVNKAEAQAWREQEARFAVMLLQYGFRVGGLV